MKKINIAIDGPAGSGKGVTSKALALKLGYIYIDSGALYRGVALYLNSIGITKENFLIDVLGVLKLSFGENGELIMDGENVEDLIRTSEIGELASDFSTMPEIRSFVNSIVFSLVKEKGCIAEGRDAASVLMPSAELKIYFTGSLEIRAKRRFLDYQRKGVEKTLEEVKEELRIRDERDMNREHAPLKKQDDAIEIDTTEMSIEQQVESVYKLAKEKIGE